MQDKRKNKQVANIWKGMVMGIAEVIPGVSGGTIALITGIYEKLIFTIRSVDFELLNVWKSNGIKGIGAKIDLWFLGYLILGMGLGILVGIFGVTYLLEHYPEPLWGFFFGLIIASCIYVGKQITKWNFANVSAMFLGAIIAYLVTIISPAEGSENLIYIFFSGAIAICALILPGISGSFILLLMGMYTLIIPTIKNFLVTQNLESLIIIVVFGMGCLTGLILFSRFMNFLFAKYKNITLATLAGFMFGSLNKIWPWRNIEEILDKNSFEKVKIQQVDQLAIYPKDGYKILSEINVLPEDYWMSSPKITGVVISVLIGFAIVFVFEFLAGKDKDQSTNLSS